MSTRHLAQARSFSFQELQAFWKTGGIGGRMKIKKYGLNEEREVNSQVGLSSLLGHASHGHDQ